MSIAGATTDGVTNACGLSGQAVSQRCNCEALQPWVSKVQ